MSTPLILISNDDGVDAQGIRQLTRMVRDLGDVVVVAPDSARSGSSMAFSCHTPLRLRRIVEEAHLRVYSCNGTPCDCVKLACEKLVPRWPDIILAGINHGDNAGVNAHYSGTIAICFEGTMKKIPSVGFSSCKLPRDADFTALTPHVRHITQAVLAQGLPQGVCLNVNFPDSETFAGVRLARMGRGNWVHELDERTDPRNHKYFWVSGWFEAEEADQTPESDADLTLLHHGYVTVTPLQIDLTAYADMDELRRTLL